MIISMELMGRVEIFKNCISVLMIIELLIILGLLIGSLTEIESESYPWFLDIKIENLQTLKCHLEKQKLSQQDDTCQIPT